MKGSSSGTAKPAVTAAVLTALWATALLTVSPLDAIAQSVAQRTPNLTNGWTPARGAQLAASSPRKADTVVVTIRNFSFVRDKITINAGDVVVWRNADPVEHVVQGDAGGFESPVEPRGDWSHRFTTPGTYTYFCKPHPFMKAEIRVREAKP